MDTISLADINIHDIGNEIQIAGTVWSGKELSFITLLPEKSDDFTNLKRMPLTLPEWERLLRQTDLLETEIFKQDPTGLTKIILRKSQRQIDNYLQWAVFKRDNYACKYCGRTGIPMTVDHVILWEDGGPTIAENLVTACRQCNKDRGRMSYEEWLSSPLYVRKSKDLPTEIRSLNRNLLFKLDSLRAKKVNHVRSR